ncbi:MAG TPA: cobalamin-binding protein [Verrucomicrobiae bacterium]|nr:cobalamin-binding protein [Verrucomicrobiae bacterium]
MSVTPRIVSLIPSATEIVYLLGLGENLVGRSHDSNYPEEALKKKVISSPAIESNLNSLEIDKAVKNLLHQGTSVFHIDQKKLARLKPDIILTQELCKVCAPTFTQVHKAAKVLEGETKIISLEPHSIGDVFENIFQIAEHSGSNVNVRSIVERLKYRLDIVSTKHKNLRKPTVAIIEWLNPLMVSGHWVPEMVQLAGGQMVLSKPGDQSRYVDWYEVVSTNPDVIIFAPCGFDIERTKKEIYLFKYRSGWENLKAVKKQQVYYMDADSYLTRSGPRLVDGVEILSRIIHPNLFGYPKTYEAQPVA